MKEALRRSRSFETHQRHLYQVYKATKAVIFSVRLMAGLIPAVWFVILRKRSYEQQGSPKYVNSKLKAGRGKKVEEIKMELLERASGVFLWVVLVVKLLNEASDYGRFTLFESA